MLTYSYEQTVHIISWLHLYFSWCRASQIVDMKYRGLTINYANIGLDMRIDMGLEVFVS